MNIILCGMMGAGKTTVGLRLALSLDRCWVDTDSLIEDEYGDIATIFQEHGEEYFRGVETKVVEELVQEDGLIISVGGGLVLKKENVELLKGSGKIVYLRASVETLEERLSGDKNRPLLKDGEESLTEKLTKMMDARAPIYAEVADFTIDVEGKNPEEVALEILAKLEEKR